MWLQPNVLRSMGRRFKHDSMVGFEEFERIEWIPWADEVLPTVYVTVHSNRYSFDSTTLKRLFGLDFRRNSSA